MGELFNKFKKSVDKGVSTVSIKSNTMVEMNRIKGIIGTLKEMIKSKKMVIGNRFYRMYLEGTIDVQKCIGLCEEIKELEEEIKEKGREIEEIKAKEGILIAEATKPKRPTPIITPYARQAQEVSVPTEVTETDEPIEEQ